MLRRTLMALVAVVVTTTACSAGPGSPGAGEGYSVLGALGDLPPASGEVMLIQTADLTAASEAVGLARPESLDVEAVNGWIGPLTGYAPGGQEVMPVFVPFPNALNLQAAPRLDDFPELLGWSVLDIDTFVEQSLHPRTFTVLTGDFDDSTLPAELVDIGNGVVSLGEGDDFTTNFDDVSGPSRLGQPVRLAQRDGRIALSPVTAPVAGWLAGTERSLADHPALAAVAQGLDDAGVVSAMLTAGGSFQGADMFGQLGSGRSVEEIREQLFAGLPDVSFGAVGIGWAVQDGSSVMTVVYHVGSQAAAEAGVAEMERVYREGLTLNSGRPVSDFVELVEARADGSVVVVTLHPTDPRSPSYLAQMLTNGDAPFRHQ